jgi:CubicO group peptidase (beta-lactamase class C family)
MALQQAVLFLCASVLASAAVPPSSSPLQAASPLQADIQRVVAAEAAKYNCTIAAAVHSETRGVHAAAAAGEVSAAPGAAASTPEDIFVWGSITKISTGAAILRRVQEGKLGLNDSIPQYVDPMLRAMKRRDPSLNFSSCADLWGDRVAQVTIYHLATMNSGIPDFDTAKPYPRPPTDSLRATIYEHPSQDYTPPDLLAVPWVHTGKLAFPPGTARHGFAYSSTNFVLLGLVLAHLDGAVSWDVFDQTSFMPADVKAKLPSVKYVRSGAPSSVSRLSGYDRTSYNGQVPANLPGIDVKDVHGVFGGWSASDYTSTVGDAAALAYEVYGPKQRIINATYQSVMVPECQDFCIYGFATFNLTQELGQKGAEGVAYGHLGATYGYQTVLAYMPALDVSIAIGSNLENDDQTHPSDTLCVLYTAVKNRLTGSTDNCVFKAGGYFSGGCKCL